MNRTARQLAALATLSLTAWGCAEFTNVAHAQAPPCGGNSKEHSAPIDCENSKTIDGVTFNVGLVVDDNGYVMVTATRNIDNGPWYLQVKAHVGISSAAGFVGVTDVFDGSTATAELNMPACVGQIDVKAVPGQPTTNHVSPNYRIAAPLVRHNNCNQPTTTTTTTVPTTAPTTVPATSSPTTTPPTTGTSTPDRGVSTTNLPPSSVVGGTIPATGLTEGQLNAAGLALFLIIPVGLFLVVIATRKRTMS